MKKLLSLLALTLLTVTGYAGPAPSGEARIEQETTYRSAEEWYRDREWNFDLFGAYGFTGQPYRSDQYLGVDHAWGGGIAATFMFSRYLGVGVEGYALAADDAIGQTSGNLVFRYPVPGTRFAPYAYAGGGVIFNGSRVEELVDRGRTFRNNRRNSDVEGMGQFGAGFEFRLTPNVGIIHDFTWNVVGGDDNDFGLVRSGVRFGF